MAGVPHSPELSLRGAAAADLPAIRALVRSSYALYVERIGKEPAPMTHDYARSLAHDRMWVAEAVRTSPAPAGGAPRSPGRTGLLGLLITVDAGDHLLLENVAVAPEAQGTGLGRVLLARAEQDARDLGHTRIELYTNAAMTENLAYYPRRGYVEVDRRTEDGFERVYFVKTLVPRGA